MTIEILFRGKHISSSKWLYGDLLQMDNGECQIIALSSDKSGYVDPATVGQKSGLKEHPGTKDIWQGDIVKITLVDTIRGKPIISDTCLVEFKDGIFGVEWGNDGHFVPLAQFAPGTIIEVIGTIHDNPELLEVE